MRNKLQTKVHISTLQCICIRCDQRNTEIPVQNCDRPLQTTSCMEVYQKIYVNTIKQSQLHRLTASERENQHLCCNQLKLHIRNLAAFGDRLLLPFSILTLCCMKQPATKGLNMPAILEKHCVTATKIPANCGAKSK